MPVSYPHQSPNEKEDGKLTCQSEDLSANILKPVQSFRDIFELLRPWLEKETLLEHSSLAFITKKQTFALFTVMEKMIKSNEIGIVFCQDFLDLYKFLKLKCPKKDIIQFITGMEKRLASIQLDTLKIRNSIIGIEYKITKLLEIDSQKLSKWTIGCSQIIPTEIVIRLVSMLSSICHRAFEQNTYIASNYKNQCQWKSSLQQVIAHLTDIASHIQVLDWNNLGDHLQKIKNELLRSDIVEVAEDKLSEIMQMGNLCRMFVFELKKVQLAQTVVPRGPK